MSFFDQYRDHIISEPKDLQTRLERVPVPTFENEAAKKILADLITAADRALRAVAEFEEITASARKAIADLESQVSR